MLGGLESATEFDEAEVCGRRGGEGRVEGVAMIHDEDVVVLHWNKGY